MGKCRLPDVSTDSGTTSLQDRRTSSNPGFLSGSTPSHRTLLPQDRTRTSTPTDTRDVTPCREAPTCPSIHERFFTTTRRQRVHLSTQTSFQRPKLSVEHRLPPRTTGPETSPLSYSDVTRRESTRTRVWVTTSGRTGDRPSNKVESQK